MIYQKILLIFMFGCFFHELEAHNKTCDTFLRELAEAQRKFVYCTTAHVSPAKTCILCYEEHKNMTISYQDITKNCSDEYINKNRLNVVYNMHKALDEFWANGFCYDCFDDNGIITNSTAKFNLYQIDFSDCVTDKPAADVCAKCSEKYSDLNLFYKDMEQQKKGRICFDTQDAMNRTRSLWSKDLNCCHRKYDFTLFFIAISIFCSLPVIFYLGMFGYTKRLERNHELLDATLNSEVPTTSAGVVSSNQSTREANSPSGSGKIVDFKTSRNVDDRSAKKGNSSKSESLATASGSASGSNMPSGSGKILDLLTPPDDGDRFAEKENSSKEKSSKKLKKQAEQISSNDEHFRDLINV